MDVAAKLGCKKATYSQKESGDRGISINEGLALAELFGLRVEDISFPTRKVHTTRTQEVAQ